MHFSRKRSSYFHNYVLQNTPLSKAESVRDLGVNFCPDLSFDKHILTITSNAFKKLGFIMRSFKYFNNTATLKFLFSSLVRPQLEYASIVWAPHSLKNSILIERIQHRFLRRLSYFTTNPMSFNDHSYTWIMQEFKILTLSDRRVLLDMVLLYKLINGYIDCPELLSLIRLHVPARSLRHNMLFHEEIHRTSYGRSKPLNRLCIEANDLSHHVDFFSLGLPAFKKRLHNYFKAHIC